MRQLEIRRIYSASPTRAATITSGVTAPLRLSVLGIMSLVVAASWMYLAWWPADRLATRNLMVTGLSRVTIPEGSLGIERMLGAAPADLADPAPPDGTEAVVQEEAGPEQMGPAREAMADGSQQVMQSLYVDMWVWLVVTTLVAAWLALSGGSASAGFPLTDPAQRRPLIIMVIIGAMAAVWISRGLWNEQTVLGLPHAAAEIALVVCALVVAWGLCITLSTGLARMVAVVAAMAWAGIVGYLWRDWYSESFAVFDWYPAAAPRIAAVALMVVAALAGAAMSRRSLALHRVGIALILVAAVTTLAALKFAQAKGGVHTHTLTGSTYLILATGQAFYAIILAVTPALRMR